MLVSYKLTCSLNVNLNNFQIPIAHLEDMFDATGVSKMLTSKTN